MRDYISPSRLRVPAAWKGHTFELLDVDGEVLVSLPPSVGDGLDLGTDDPYTYDRAPGSSVFFPLGDEFGDEPPRLKLSGDWIYRDVTEALTHPAEIERALGTAQAPGAARTLQWRGQQVAQLTPLLPGTLRVVRVKNFPTVAITLTLNLTAPLTNVGLAEGQLT